MFKHDNNRCTFKVSTWQSLQNDSSIGNQFARYNLE